MSIDTYQTPEALALSKRIGMPKWENSDGFPFHLAIDTDDGTGWWGRAETPGQMNEELPDHLALCLLRNHLREWLRSQREEPPQPYWLDGEFVGWSTTSKGHVGTNEDEALLAACAAMDAEMLKER